MEKIKLKFMLAIMFTINLIIMIILYEDIIYIVDEYIALIILAYFIVDVFSVLLPKANDSIYSGKLFKKFYMESAEYSQEKLKKESKRITHRGYFGLLVYFIFIGTIGILYYNIPGFKVIYLYLIFSLLNLSDYFCILIWCPFRNIFFGNKCCNTCRISNWDRIMKFSILIFIPDAYISKFITVTLLALGILTALQWEYKFYTHPERFNSVSNEHLRCGNCDHMDCSRKRDIQLKNAIKNKYNKIKEKLNK